mmetsp:Transcript_31491/g.60717  ORF Transcript_31491/g.60717 Transcript_31491/m.60717 type:complete len:220 (+) Transcript_31491:203-862(+)
MPRMKDQHEMRARYQRFVEPDRFLHAIEHEDWPNNLHKSPTPGRSILRNRGQAPVVQTVGRAKGHQYLWNGTDTSGPDTTARHGPRTDVLRPVHDPRWRGGGANGEKVPNNLMTPALVYPPMRVMPSSSLSAGSLVPKGKEWADPQFNGVNTASQYHNFVSSGAHKVHSLEHPISYKTRREPGIDVAVGRGGNLGCYSKAHAGWMTRSSLTFHRREAAG